MTSTTHTRRFDVAETHGGLPYLLTWLSLDGRPHTEYFGDYEAANLKAWYLTEIGRQPKVWADLTSATVHPSVPVAETVPTTDG